MSKIKLVLKYRVKQTGDRQNLICRRCRHANQQTDDFQDGLVFCQFAAVGIKGHDHQCDVSFSDMIAFEEYDGSNCTWRKDGEYEITYEMA